MARRSYGRWVWAGKARGSTACEATPNSDCRGKKKFLKNVELITRVQNNILMRTGELFGEFG